MGMKLRLKLLYVRSNKYPDKVCNRAPDNIIILLVNAIVVARILGEVASEFSEKHSNIELVKNPKAMCNSETHHNGITCTNNIKLIDTRAPINPTAINMVRCLK